MATAPDRFLDGGSSLSRLRRCWQPPWVRSGALSKCATRAARNYMNNLYRILSVEPFTDTSQT